MQCAGVVNVGGEVGCLISEGPWIFVGLPNVVKVKWEANLPTPFFGSSFSDLSCC